MSINRNLARFAPSINSSGQVAVAIATMTVVILVAINIKSMAQLNKRCRSLKGLHIGLTKATVQTVVTLAFSTTSNGSHGGGSAFTTGVTTVGTAGSAGAYVEVTLEQDAPDHLYYYCTNTAGWGV